MDSQALIFHPIRISSPIVFISGKRKSICLRFHCDDYGIELSHLKFSNYIEAPLRKLMARVSLFTGISQNVSLLALTLVGERENGNLHTIFFCFFIGFTYFYCVSLTYICRSSDYYEKNREKAKRDLKQKISLIFVLTLLLPIVFALFFVYFLKCLRFTYELFCLSEYLTICVIFAFHLTTLKDLNFNVILVHKTHKPLKFRI
ncbi:unnamed protein product, partial [Mesorhabditis belari]|uniref:CWH43-like N-terminal domain-containing protein n=1 Tax=Mesorhabditis belari TaxID=2138241 RepID=A0AAF3J8G2_9BILA